MITTIDQISITLKPLFRKLPVDIVYLYGSYASGKKDFLSDYDIGILFSEKLTEKKRFDLRLRLFGEIAKRLSVTEDLIDIVDLAEVSLLLQFNVICGKVVYKHHEERRIAFETYIMSRYHDEHYYYDRYLKETIEKIEKGVYFDRRISYS